MPSERVTDLSPLQAFRAQYWKDRESWAIRDLHEYLVMFPGDDVAVAREYLTLGGDVRAWTGAEPGVAASDWNETDQMLGPYQLRGEVGRGGQGIVYQAWDTRLRRRVAVKVLKDMGPESGELIHRFRREVEAAARLDHPGICPVYDARIDGGMPYIAMRFVEGETLARRIAATVVESKGDALGTVDLQEVALPERRHDSSPSSSGPRGRSELMRVVLLIERTERARHVAHEAGIVHRDIKPGNVIVTPGGEPVLMDFGLARDDASDLATFTRTGDLFGTPAYMSPEQLTRRTKRLDRRTDVWSLGVTLYECATLKRPFRGAIREALYQQILTQEPTDPRRLNSSISRDLATVIATALEKDPDRRYQTALDMAEDLRRIREYEPIQARPTGRWVRLTRWAQRNPSVAASLAAAGLFLVGGVGTSLYQAAKAHTKAVEAEANLRSWRRVADFRLLQDLEREAETTLWPPWPREIPAMTRWLERAEELLTRRSVHEQTLSELRVVVEPYSEADRAQDRRTHPKAAELVDLRERIADLSREIVPPGGGFTGLEARSDVAPRTLETEEIRTQGAELAGLRARVPALEAEVAHRRTWSFRDSDLQDQHDFLADLCRGLARLESQLTAEVRERRDFASQITRQSIGGHRAAWDAAMARVASDERFLGFELSTQVGLVPLGPDPDSRLEEFALQGQAGPGDLHLRAEDGQRDREAGLRAVDRRAASGPDRSD